MPTATQSAAPFEIFLGRLGECHDLSAYEAVERLMWAAESAGIDVGTLIRMLDQGMTFEKLLVFVETKIERLQNAA